MSSRKKRQKPTERDSEKSLADPREAAARAQTRTKPPAIRIIEALTERFDKSTNPLGLDANMPMEEYIKLQRSGKLAEMEERAEHVDRWLTEEEMFNAAMADHIKDHGHYGALSFFNEAMRGLKSAQLITKGPFKKTWLLRTTSSIHSFLGSFKPGERFTTEALAEYAGMSVSWAAHKLAATGKLGLTRQVKVRLHERT